MDIDDEALLLREALDSMRDLVIIKGPRSRLIWANKAFRDYYGMTRDELLDLIDGPQADPDDTLQYVRDDALVFTTGDHVDVGGETVTDHRGEARLFHTIKSPVRLEGQVSMSVGVSRRREDTDLRAGTPHLEAKALSKSLRLLTSAFPLAALVLDGQQRIVSSSPVWQEVFGPVASQPDTFFAEVHPGMAALGPALASTLETGEPGLERVRLELDDGTADYEFRVGPWCYGDGTTGGVLILGLDVTTETVQTARLEDANERFDLVLAGASVGIWDWIDVTADEEHWSDRFYQLLGFQPGEIEASLSNFADLLHPDDNERTFALVDEHLATNAPFEVDYRLRTKSGQYRWYRGTGKAARNAEGEPTRMVGSIQDITESVNARLAIERMNEDLEHFAHVAAHDLREPARRQQMLIELAIDDHGDSIPPELRNDLEKIRHQSEDMLAMITGFRSLTGLSGPALEIEPVDLQELTEGVVDDVLAGADGHRVTIDLPRELPAYPSLVELLIRNLTTNALRHGSDPVDLSFGHSDRRGEVVITAENAWDGDPSSLPGDLFRPFATDRSGRGAGLGLSICRRVVDHHRGWIEANPKPGSFEIEFNLGRP